MEKGFQLRNYHIRRGSRPKDSTPLYPITKAENIIGGAGVTQVAELPATGDEGKIYYNTTEKKYYTYTEENGWSEIGSGGSDGPTYELKYQYNPMLCGGVNLNNELPSCLDELGFVKEGTAMVVGKDGADDTVFSQITVDSDIATDNFYTLALILEDEFSEYLATLGIDWNTVDKSTISDITHNVTVDLFDMRNLYGQEMSNIQDEWVVCKYTVNFEIGVEEFNNNWICVANGTVTSREYITSGTIVYPKMHIKYLMQPKGSFTDSNEEQIPTCGLAINTMGTCYGTINRSLDDFSTKEYHVLGNSGFAVYNDINFDNPITRLEIVSRFGDGDSTIFDFPLFDNLNIVGRFFTGDHCNIVIDDLMPAENNPDIESSSVYEYHIMYPVFSLIKLTEREA